MKKLIALLCMITCIFGLTACGGNEVVNEYDQQKATYAAQMAAEKIVPTLLTIDSSMYEMYNGDEMSYIVGQEYTLNVDGDAFISAMTSFEDTLEVIGGVTGVGAGTAVIDDDTIIVTVPVMGVNKNASAEVILSNDIFMTLEAAALNEESTFGDSMTKAALNTLLGIGTVFMVLIIIIIVISLFGFIPKIQAMLDKKKESKTAPAAAPAPVAAPAPIEEEVVDYSDDLELVAVIAAAIAAYEGETTTDGFVVRSIRKVNKRR